MRISDWSSDVCSSDLALAFCGGIDMTADRWDTSAHLDDDPRRRRPSGRCYGAWHDATVALDSEAAKALGEIGRDRWRRACGEALPVPSATGADRKSVGEGKSGSVGLVPGGRRILK